jgi:autophagy-related protein 18
MSFNLNATLLCVSSASETVHIFRLGGGAGGGAGDGEGTQASDQAIEPFGPGSPERGRPRSVSNTSSTPSDLGLSEGSGPDAANIPRKHNGTLGSMFRRSSQTIGKTFAHSVGGYLPSAVAEMWEPARDFAYIKIPKRSAGGAGTGPLRSVVAMSSSSPQVMVVTSEGIFYLFNIDLEKGGEGVLVKQYS